MSLISLINPQRFIFGILHLNELCKLLDKSLWSEYKFICNPAEWLKLIDSTGKLWYPITDEKGEKIIKLWACKTATQEDVDRTAGNEFPFKLGDEFCDETDEVILSISRQVYGRVLTETVQPSGVLPANITIPPLISGVTNTAPTKRYRVVYSYPEQQSIGSDKSATVSAVDANEACAKVREILEDPNRIIEVVEVLD